MAFFLHLWENIDLLNNLFTYVTGAHNRYTRSYIQTLLIFKSACGRDRLVRDILVLQGKLSWLKTSPKSKFWWNKCFYLLISIHNKVLVSFNSKLIFDYYDTPYGHASAYKYLIVNYLCSETEISIPDIYTAFRSSVRDARMCVNIPTCSVIPSYFKLQGTIVDKAQLEYKVQEMFEQVFH